MKNTLLPERHPIKDFFIPDIFDALPVKCDRHTLEHPFFTLSTKKDIRTVRYERNGVQIMLSPSAEYGLPNMMDKDILLYLGSQVMAEVNKGKTPPKTIRFSVHDLMVTTNRETNGKGYQLIKNAFERLAGCLVTTNIKTNDIEQAKGFHLLEGFGVIKNHKVKDRMIEAETTLPDWFYYALLGEEVLTINRHYFRLRKPLERRLYELARKHCGKQGKWLINVANLHVKSGSLSPVRKFRFQLRKIIELNQTTGYFPDYEIALQDDGLVRFTPKSAFKDVIAKEEFKKQVQADSAIPKVGFQARDKARDIVAKAGTGWDYYALEAEFNYSLQQGFRPDSVDGAFINFVKMKVVNYA